MQPISYEKYQLANGLTVLIHHDPLTPMAVVNTLYKVGARNEVSTRTGFAHLFEHLMFGGSQNAPHFDAALQEAGGNNNAFTNNDLTNYYDILPADNLETALWLESDRMHFLHINERSLDVQRKVVIEEFKENYLNQPYGQLWHQVRQLCYTQHPYRWPTIGLTPQHVAEATLSEVQAFYQQYYTPNNAILTIAGGVAPDQALPLVERYFGDIPTGPTPLPDWPTEPAQMGARHASFEDDVPLNMLIMAYPMADRTDKGYYEADLISDILSSGSSSRLYLKLVKEQQLFNELQAFISGNLDPGLFVIRGRLNEGVSYDDAQAAIQQELQRLQDDLVPRHELEKVKNKVESGYEYNTINLMNRAYALSYFENLGDANGLNTEKEHYLSVSAAALRDRAIQLFDARHLNLLEYRAKQPAYAG